MPEHEPAEDPKDAAQAALEGCGVEVDQIWQHYKGGLYVVVAVGIKEDTLEPMIGYRSNLDGTTWFRTLANWMDAVEVAQGPPGGTRRARFTRLWPAARVSPAGTRQADDAVHARLEYPDQPLSGPIWDDRH